MEKDAFIMQLKQIIEIKEKVRKLIESLGDCPSNSLIESLYLSIANDAKKHLDIFQGLLDRALGLNKPLEEDKITEILETLAKVRELEWNIGNQIRTIINKVTDEKTKSVLTSVLGDIQRHEFYLRNLQEFINVMTENEEKIVEKIWKYSIHFDDDDE
ncbi:MAG: hypothetical protein ACTSUR_07270 [Candidatus Heimdallarchaeaceae archaeon]